MVITSDSASVESQVDAVPALSVVNVSKSFPGMNALKGLNLDVIGGEIRSLIGGNGSGKSTFIKILSGYHRPDVGGEIRINGEVLHVGHPKASYRLGARFVHQDLGLVNDCSVMDNLFLGSGFITRLGTIRGRLASQRAQSALEIVGLDVDVRKPVEVLSAVEKTGVAVARALNGSDEFPIRLLVLDEPTATLPAQEVEVLLRMVQSVAKSGVAVLYVTHRLEEVFRISKQVTILRNGSHVATVPIEGLSRAELLNYVVGSDFVEVKKDGSAVATSSGGPAISVQGLCARGLVDVTFDVAPGEIVGISGVTGSGREMLNSAIFGAVSRQAGEVKAGTMVIPARRPDIAIRAGVVFMPSDRRVHGGLMEMSAAQNCTITSLKEFSKYFTIRQKKELAETTLWSERMDVRPRNAFTQRLALFSGGNQQKILLAKWLRLNPRVLLLEEPTQGVDIAAKAIIHGRLMDAAKSGASLVISSADVDELVALCSRILILREGRLVASLSGETLNVGAVIRESLMAKTAGLRTQDPLSTWDEK